MNLSILQQEFLAFKKAQNISKEPINLYKPVEYILSLDGKKIRPLLTLIAASLYSDDVKKALPAAYAIEMFHNFTLMHDDIMDDAPLRRGKETVHEKWNINTGILSGDAMLILTYKYLESYPPKQFKKLIQLLSKTAIEVCEGQQLDVDFETRNNVTIDEYILMITLKTSVLIGAALKMGAIINNASKKDAQKLYEYGLNLGIAFQLQDDYLDTFGNPESFGKQVGGDIIENKKTYLFLKTLEVASKEDKEVLMKLYLSKLPENTNKIDTVKTLFNKYEIPSLVKNQVEFYNNKAFKTLNDLTIPETSKKELLKFGESLMTRKV